MKVAAFLVSVMLSTAALTVAIFVLILLYEDVGVASIILVSVAVGVFAIAGPVAGAALAFWGPDPDTRTGRNQLVRTRWMSVAAAVAAAVLLIGLAIFGPIPAPFVVVVIVAGSLWLWVHLVIGQRIGRREAVRRAEAGRVAVLDANLSRRRLRAIAITMPVVFVAAAIALLSFGVFADDDEPQYKALVLVGCYSLGIAGFAGTGIAIVTTFTVNALVRDVTGVDFATSARLSKAITRGKTQHLSVEDRDVASNWAPLAAIQMRWGFLQTTLLFVSLLAQNFGSAFGSDEFRPFNFWIAVALGLLLICTLPLVRRNYLRLQRYAQEHPADRDELAAPAAQ